METLYRKVAVSEKHPKEDGFYYVFNGLKHSTYYSKLLGFNYCMGQINMSNKITHWLEEIHDPNAQLKTDKAELLELMTEMKESFDHKAWVTEMELRSFSSRIESLIQKHKQ